MSESTPLVTRNGGPVALLVELPDPQQPSFISDGCCDCWSMENGENPNLVRVPTVSARDHLANERTYLAWMRTSLALVGASIGLLKWDAVNDAEGYLVGAVGIVALVTSTYRYFYVMRRLRDNQYEPNVIPILVMVVVVSVTIVVAFFLHYRSSKLAI